MVYTLQGILMDKNTGKPFNLDGQNVTAQASFTPVEKNGETLLYFSFDADNLFKDAAAADADEKTETGTEEKALQTLQLVAFEELYITGEEKTEEESSAEDEDTTGFLVAEHKDLEDPAQTVVVKEPQKPREPDKPVTPENPEKPVEPQEPGKVRKKNIAPARPATVRSGSAVMTGDDTKPVIYLIPALVSALAIAGILFAKRRKKADRKE
jgi:hypothetical protein